MRRCLALALSLLALTCTKAPRPALGLAPAFDLPAVAGGRVSVATLRGKVVVLDFWATWCAPCLKELPGYVEFWKKNQSRGVEVVGVVFDSGDPQDVADFVREHRIPYKQLLGTDDLLDTYDANQGFPTTFVIDSRGVLRSKTIGSVPDKFERLQRDVDAALGAP